MKMILYYLEVYRPGTETTIPYWDADECFTVDELDKLDEAYKFMVEAHGPENLRVIREERTIIKWE